MIIALASDHAGFTYKEEIKRMLEAERNECRDFGTDSAEPVDYPLFMRPAAISVAAGDCERGIILGGSGNGEAMVANRVAGVRCAVVWSDETAKLARRHNDANMISLGQRVISLDDALRFVRTFLTEPFDGGRHERRVAMIDNPVV